MQDVPHALTECEADITRINESLNEVPDIDISSTSSLNFDFFFNSQLSGINGFKGFVNRIYYPQYEGVNLINLGYKISGRINQDETFTNLYKGGIELLSPISCKKSIEVQLLSHNDYIDLLNSGNLRIYQYENFRSDFSFWYFSTNEWEEDIDKISGIIVDEISIDYFYEKENDVVIPILNHQAHYNGVKGRVDFNFWVWGINVK
jgi:hypothetical protein